MIGNKRFQKRREPNSRRSAYFSGNDHFLLGSWENKEELNGCAAEKNNEI